jgi:plasmid stabilization system protein ParE
MLKVNYSPAAFEDLQHIRDYISDNWGEDVAIRS